MVKFLRSVNGCATRNSVSNVCIRADVDLYNSYDMAESGSGTSIEWVPTYYRTLESITSHVKIQMSVDRGVGCGLEGGGAAKCPIIGVQ